MDCSQNNDLITFLIKLGILPCLGITFLLVASAFLVSAILNNILISTLNGQPIHWF